LGRSGWVVSEVCLGTMTYGNMSDEKERLAILDQAFAGGVDYLDVAEVYPVPPNPELAGRSEQIVGKWLGGRSRDSVVVATKVAGPGGGWFVPPVRGGRTSLDGHHIERAVEASLKRLGTDYIDLYQTHWPDPDLPIDVTLEGLDRVARPLREPLAEDLLAAPDVLGVRRHRVDLGDVEEVDAAREGLIEDGQALAHVGHVAEGHRAQAHLRDHQAAAAQATTLHPEPPRGRPGGYPPRTPGRTPAAFL
jgi:hypothetical protein